LPDESKELHLEDINNLIKSNGHEELTEYIRNLNKFGILKRTKKKLLNSESLSIKIL